MNFNIFVYLCDIIYTNLIIEVIILIYLIIILKM